MFFSRTDRFVPFSLCRVLFLQDGDIAFTPALPSHKREAIGRLLMGQAGGRAFRHSVDWRPFYTTHECRARWGDWRVVSHPGTGSDQIVGSRWKPALLAPWGTCSPMNFLRVFRWSKKPSLPIGRFFRPQGGRKKGGPLPPPTLRGY